MRKLLNRLNGKVQGLLILPLIPLESYKQPAGVIYIQVPHCSFICNLYQSRLAEELERWSLLASRGGGGCRPADLAPTPDEIKFIKVWQFSKTLQYWKICNCVCACKLNAKVPEGIEGTSQVAFMPLSALHALALGTTFRNHETIDRQTLSLLMCWAQAWYTHWYAVRTPRIRTHAESSVQHHTCWL